MSSYSLCNAVGALSFIVLMVLLVMTDSLFDEMSNIQHRKVVVAADVIFHVRLLHLYFV